MSAASERSMECGECGKFPLVGHAPRAQETAPLGADGPGSKWRIPAISREVISRSAAHIAQCRLAVTEDLARAVVVAARPISRRRVSRQWRSGCWARVRQWFSSGAQGRGDGPPVSQSNGIVRMPVPALALLPRKRASALCAVPGASRDMGVEPLQIRTQLGRCTDAGWRTGGHAGSVS